jgi:ATP-dependent RNA helicase DHX29
MAGGKKKKKAAANPARGFATTSVPSKPKMVQPDEDEVSPPTPTPGDDKGSSTTKHLDRLPDVSTPNFQNMMPDDFEAYLEDAELQIMLDANTARCKSEATRQSSRLQGEVRQLRSQSSQLTIHNWLDDTAANKILSLPLEPSSSPSHFEPLKSGDQKLVLDLWILQRVLSALALPQIDQALRHVAGLALTRRLTSDGAYVWGLVEALDWLASNVAHKTLPSYQSSSVTSDATSSQPHQASHAATNETRTQSSGTSLSHQSPTPGTATTSSQVLTPTTDDISEQSRGSTPSTGATTPSNLQTSDEESSDEDQNDPMHLVERHVQLRTEIWNREHKAFHLRKSKGHEVKTEKQRAKLKKIERDMLFDKDESDRIWQPILVGLKAKENLRLRQERQVRQKPRPAEKPSNAKAVAESSAPANGEVDEDEDADVFGGMFAADADPNDHQPQPLATNIRIVDFGTSIGTKPRQLLEQTCRTIDPAFTLKFMALQQTSYSNRHRLELMWSADKEADRHAIQAVSDEVTVTIEPQHWVLEMGKTAAATNEQSISYAATVMLFLVSSLDAQDGQISLRLAGAWRELVVKLHEKRKEAVNAYDKLALKDIRHLVNEAIESWESSTKSNDTTTADDNNNHVDLTVRQGPNQNSTFDPERAQREWFGRASHPAFKRMLASRERLPIYSHKEHILTQIAMNPITILCAETGSGKLLPYSCMSFKLTILRQEHAMRLVYPRARAICWSRLSNINHTTSSNFCDHPCTQSKPGAW